MTPEEKAEALYEQIELVAGLIDNDDQLRVAVIKLMATAIRDARKEGEGLCLNSA